jgi:DNA-binding transcriptional regulator YhcF (GntR family)
MKNSRRGLWNQAQAVWDQLDGVDIKILELIDYLERRYSLAFPSRELLAKKLKVSVSTISRHTTKLAALGVLAVKPRKYRRHDGTFVTQSNVYKILGLIGAKIRSLIHRLTDGARTRRIPKQQEKEELPDLFTFSHVKNPEVKHILERWVERGRKEEGAGKPVSPCLPH